MKKMMFGLFAAALLTSVVAVAQEADDSSLEGAIEAISEGRAAEAEAEAVAAADPEVAELETSTRCPFIPHIYLDATIQNRYMSDGEIVNPDTMSMMDAGLAWECGLYADIWGAWDLNNYNKDSHVEHDFEEVDYTIGFANKIDDVPFINALKFNTWWSYWYYPKRTGWACVGETQQTLGLDLVADVFLNPGIKFKWDYENSELQIVPHISYAYDFNESLTANTSLELFWFNANWRCGAARRHRHNDADAQYTYDKLHNSGFATLVWSASLDYKINEYFTCGPFAKLSFNLDKTTRKKWDAHGSPNNSSGVNDLVGFKVSAFF